LSKNIKEKLPKLIKKEEVKMQSIVITGVSGVAVNQEMPLNDSKD
jgi:hypothetical protein